MSDRSDDQGTSLETSKGKIDEISKKCQYDLPRKVQEDYEGVLTRVIEKYMEVEKFGETDENPLPFKITKTHIEYIKSLLDPLHRPKSYINHKNIPKSYWGFMEVETPIEKIMHELSYARTCKINNLEYLGKDVSFLLEILELLLKFGANPNNVAEPFVYVISHALYSRVENVLEVVMVLLKYGADTETDLRKIESRTSSVITPLYRTILLGYVEIAKRIFLHGAIINIDCLKSRNFVEKSGTPPLLHQLVNIELDQVGGRHASDFNVKRLCKLYKEMGGDLFAVDDKGHNVFAYLVKSHPLRGSFKDKVDSRKVELTECLTELLVAPLSLQSLSRLAVVKAMGRGCWDNIDRLPLPMDLKKVLRFEFD